MEADTTITEVPDMSILTVNMSSHHTTVQDQAANGVASEEADGSKLPENLSLTSMKYARKSLEKNSKRKMMEMAVGDAEANGQKRELKLSQSQRKPSKFSQAKLSLQF